MKYNWTHSIKRGAISFVAMALVYLATHLGAWQGMTVSAVLIAAAHWVEKKYLS